MGRGLLKYDFKVSTAGSASTAAPAPAAVSACSGSSWVQGKQYAAGSVVSHSGKQYVAKFATPSYTPTMSTYYGSLSAG